MNMIIDEIKEFFGFWKTRPVVMAAYGVGCWVVGRIDVPFVPFI